MSKRFIITALISLGLVTFTGGAVFGTLYSQELRQELARSAILAPPHDPATLQDEVKDLIRLRYAGDVPNGALNEGAIKGMVEALDDPYSGYFSSKDLEHFRMDTEGFFYGVGLQVEMKNKKVTIADIIEDSPASKTTIKVGDTIIEVDGKSVKGTSLDAVVEKIRGPKGSQVKIGLERLKPRETFSVTITRDKITTKNVSSKMIEGNIGYVRLAEFNETGTRELKEHITKLKDRGAGALILDLRSNPGGFLEDAVAVSNLFLPRSKLILTEKLKYQPDKSHRTTKEGDTKTPLVVLIDENSASASEIVAAALRDHKRAVLVGEKTFGKASVQEIIPLTNGGAVKLTIAKYLTPKGVWINKVGVKPDHLVKMEHGKRGKDDIQLQKAVDILKTRLAGAGLDEAA